MTGNGKIFDLLAAGILLAGSLAAAEWKIKDGAGNAVLRDSGPDKIDLAVATPETVTWAREDDRGSFLNFSGGTVTGPAEKLLFPEGMILEIDFSADLKSGGEWLPLVTCGNSFQNGYAVWVRRNGQLLVSLPGTEKWYRLFNAGLKNLEDYKVRIIRGRDRCVVLLDGKVIADYDSPGKVKNTPGEPFRLGSTPKWKFYGNLYGVKLAPFREGAFDFAKKAEKELSGTEIVEVPGIEDPPGTVVIADFGKFSPAPSEARNYAIGGWLIRKGKIFPPPARVVLHSCENPDAEDISYAPGLKGVYDVYLGLRAVYRDTDMMLSLPGIPERIRVRILPIHWSYGKHTNTEVLVARGVKMDGGKIVLHPGGFMYLGYIKLIPSAAPRKKDYPKWKCVTVTREKNSFREIWDRKIRSLIAKRYFIERKYVDEKKPPVPSAASEKLGCVVSAHDWMDLLFENAVPAKDPGKVSLAVKAAPGEYEPACLAVYGLRDLDKVALSGGEELAKAGIASEIAVVRSLPKRTTTIRGPSEFIYAPQYLEEVRETVLKKGVSKLFWITFKAADTAKPGAYRGRFTLKTPSGKREIPVTVTVRSFRLDPLLREAVGYFGDTYEHRPERAERLAEHGCNTVFFHIGTDFALTPGGVDMERSVAPKIVERMKPYHLRLVVVRVQDLTFGTFKNRASGGEELFKKTIRQILDYARKHNWPEVCFYTCDEVLSESHNLPKALWETRLLKACGAEVFSTHIWYKTTRKFKKEVAELAPQIDIFCNRFSTRKLWYVDDWQEMQDRAEKEGKRLFSYNIDNAIFAAQPAMKRFACGWFFRTCGDRTTGQMIYYTYLPVISPYTDLDGHTVDYCYKYPAGRGHAGGFAIDLEAVREGVDDLRYITTLENRIAEAKKKGFEKEAAAAEKVLNDLKKSFDHGKNFVKNSVFLDSRFEKRWEKNGQRFCAGRLNLPNGWRYEDYHAAREKIAAEIIKLNRVLK